MIMNDNEFFDAVKATFSIIPPIITTDSTFTLTDKEKYLMIKQAKTFKLNIKENDLLVKDGAAVKCMNTKDHQIAHYPKEVFGFPIIVHSVPIINENTGNVLGSFTFAVSQEKEQELFDMSKSLQIFSEDLSTSTEEIAASTEELASNTQNVNLEITEVKDQIKELDSIIDYVKSVADSTNLLGLNAAIEAARAGESGKGFSVVAQEIRKLAVSSKSSSAKITASLEEIRKKINKVVDNVNELATISEQQAAQTELIASNSTSLSQISSKLNELANNIL